ncbi:MAG: hypothetical protein RMJ60_07335 [Anaerolineales bacterium]|nr:hypothetical protein [Anaerolineales bacterium]
MTITSMRLLLVIFLFAMYVLALVYLRRRPLTRAEFACWALFALLLPLLGPFLVLIMRPPLRGVQLLIFPVRNRRRK